MTHKIVSQQLKVEFEDFEKCLLSLFTYEFSIFRFGCTVRLGYNELGYTEQNPVIKNNIYPFGCKNTIKYL